jgi:hypothetical protein
MAAFQKDYSTYKRTLRNILGDPISREAAMDLIQKSPSTLQKFLQFSKEHQENLLAFIQGNKGLPILYDGFYKYVLDPTRHPERLESFLSELFGQPVTIMEVLTKEGSQLIELGSLVVMDVIVKLSDGSIVDVEMQKHGYLFTGERSSCYMSDMVMRQYNRIKSEEKEKFNFGHMKPVHLIILMENSSKEFKNVAPHYIHHIQHSFDTGAQLNLLTNLTYISLDTFHLVGQNITSRMDGWLTFLSSDKPEDILQLVEKYPEFEDCYHDIMMFRKKPEELMNMFSEALLTMDKNTVNYMIEEQQKEIEQQKLLLEEQKAVLEEVTQENKLQKTALEEATKEYHLQKAALEEATKENHLQKAALEEAEKELAALRAELDKLRR